MSLRILTLPTLFLLLNLCVTPAYAEDTKEDHMSLARDMANMTLSMITNPQKKPEERIAGLKRGFGNIVDTAWIARFVLGNTWRKASEEQRARYTELYHEFLMNTYISTYATDDTKKVTDITVVDIKEEADGQFTTRTEVRLTGGQSLKVDYRVHSKDGGYKIIDVIIEDISLLSTHRSEFMQTASAAGVDGVINKLEKLVN